MVLLKTGSTANMQLQNERKAEELLAKTADAETRSL